MRTPPPGPIRRPPPRPTPTKTPPSRLGKTLPEEFVRKRYQQQLLVVEDHDSEWVAQNYLSSSARPTTPHGIPVPDAAEDFDIDMKLSSAASARPRPETACQDHPHHSGRTAERDGRLQPGDKIVAWPRRTANPWTCSTGPPPRRPLIRGPRGTKVTLSVVPAADVSGRTVKIELTRDEVKLEEAAAKSEVRDVAGSGAVPGAWVSCACPPFTPT